MSAHYYPPNAPLCPRCRKKRLPGQSKSSPFGDLLCDTCAVPNAGDKDLIQLVNSRVTRRKLEAATQEVFG
jgi:hypothetical protein